MAQPIEEKLREEKKQIEQALLEKNNFMAKLSHDFRSPLNGIIGFAELMYHGKVGAVSPEHKEYLADILKSAHQLLILVNEVLDIAKAEAGKIEFHPEDVNLEKILSETKGIFKTLITSKKIQFETYVEPTLKNIRLDSTRLKQVIYNYVSNALKYAPDNGTVSVRILADKKNKLRLEVQDNGKGIRPEDFGRLFVEFQQLDPVVAKKYPSTGLGLALTKRIVQAQGGEVGVQSVPGKGSQFFATLPYELTYSEQHK